MPEEFISRTYDELFKEFEGKITFLPGEPYKFIRKIICKHINVTNENLNNYLNKSKSLSREKLVDMLTKLNIHYSDVWKRSEFLPESLKPYAFDESLAQIEAAPQLYLTQHVSALTEMVLEFISGSEGKSLEQLQEEFQLKKDEIAKRSAG